MGIAGDPLVAVVVQALIPAEVAGVLFTVDPHSGSHEHWMVEASWGLGEAVVVGLVMADRYIIFHRGKVVECRIGLTDEAVVPQEHGGTSELEIDDPARVQDACLNEEALARIAELGAACERLFGIGQDIEWTLAGENIYLLQARPVTGRDM
jgi:pyruvate, water dikinase